ncbi:MAG: ribosome biogenesis GTPase YlqF [Bacilli bacterium]|nr:ribosome biogenesis GTPase YlqF [Bacilli bacterium]
MIQWYPGHMAKALREVSEKVRLVDVVMIVLDARVPASSLNPEIVKLVNNKKVLIVLNKRDKADNSQTALWKKYYETKNYQVVTVNSKDNSDVKKILAGVKELMVEKRAKDALKGLKPRPIKTMIIGIPNAGKSTIINGLVHKKVATVGDKPGVTKNQQWIRINQVLELLDTPGILWPKFENQEIASNLAVTGAIKDEIVDVYELGKYSLNFYLTYYKNELVNRYELKDTELEIDAIYHKIALKNGLYRNDKTIDFDRVSLLILNDIRSGRLGKITLDRYRNE